MRLPWPLGRSSRRLTWKTRGALALAAVAVVYAGFTLVEVLIAARGDYRSEVDAIVVMGAAQYDGDPSPVFAGRLDHALDLWAEGVGSVVVTTGSKRQGDRFTEGYAGFEYLRYAGIPEADLLVVTDGGSTWQQLSAASRELRARGLHTAVLVSDPYHSLRLRHIAGELGLAGGVSSTDQAVSLRQYARETAAVSLGRIIGYDRLDRWFG